MPVSLGPQILMKPKNILRKVEGEFGNVLFRFFAA